MNRRNGESGLLERLIADERDLPQPERDWRRIEADIFARLAEPVEPATTQSPPLVYLAIAFAAAAGLALLLTSLRPAEPASLASAPAERSETNAKSALKNDTVAPRSERGTAAGSGHVEHAEHAHWTLEPGSSARVRRDGALIVLELESGSVDAEIEPGQAPETFVVEAGDVRVAVHGTQFRVERRGEMVDVSVWEGVVSVGTKREPRGMKLSAPASKRFIDGKVLSHAPALPAAGRPRSTAPEEPSISDVEAGVSRIQAAAQNCFARHTSAKDGVQVSARSSVLLSVRPDGSVSAQAFEPPLAPNVEACTRAGLGKIHFAVSQRGIELSRTLDLSR